MSNIDNRTYSIEIDGYEVLWFGDEERSEAYQTFSKLVRDSAYNTKDLVLINVATDTELGHRFTLKLAA